MKRMLVGIVLIGMLSTFNGCVMTANKVYSLTRDNFFTRYDGFGGACGPNVHPTSFLSYMLDPNSHPADRIYLRSYDKDKIQLVLRYRENHTHTFTLDGYTHSVSLGKGTRFCYKVFSRNEIVDFIEKGEGLTYNLGKYTTKLPNNYLKGFLKAHDESFRKFCKDDSDEL